MNSLINIQKWFIPNGTIKNGNQEWGIYSETRLWVRKFRDGSDNDELNEWKYGPSELSH
jgi:hypothetical protein